MLAVKGYSRFPIFYNSSGTRILGYESPNPDFNKYVSWIYRPAIAIYRLRDLKFRRRFIVNEALNPQLKTREIVPPYIYVFPDYEAAETLNNCYAMGITLKGPRTPIFLPLIMLRALTEKEVKALLHIAEVNQLSREKIFTLLNLLNIEYQPLKVLAGGKTVFEIRDPEVDTPYKVLVNPLGQVEDVNFCVELPEKTYLPELIMLTRQQKNLYILSEWPY